MSPLAKQVVRQFGLIYVASVVVMTLVIIAFDTVRVLQREGLSPLQTLLVLPYLLPAVGRMAMQGSVLYASCFVYGRMSAGNELLALNASGVSTFGVIWPTLVLTLPLCLSGVWLEDVAVSWGRDGVQRAVCEAAVDIAYVRLDESKMFSTPDCRLTVADVRGRRLIHPTLKLSAPDAERRVELSADAGELRYDRVKNQLVLTLEDGTLTGDDGYCLSFPDKFHYSLPLTRESNRAVSIERIREQRAEIVRLECALAERRCARRLDEPLPFTVADEGARPLRAVRDAAVRPATAFVERPAEAASPSDTSATQSASTPPTEADDLDAKLDAARLQLHKLRMEWHQKWANSFCCLAFALVGIPVAVNLKRTDFLSTFVACFLPVLGVFQPLQYFGCALSSRGVISPWWLHANNVLLGIVGVVLLRRLAKQR